jgi:2,4-dienoyl-CoA reductase-like NADH-dependent reductase (Old Yellow Enzyme family)
MPLMAGYLHVLAPVTVGPVTLRNRVVVTSHQTGLVHDHLPTVDLIAYHQARAEGGAGAVFLEATAVHDSGLLTAHTLGGYLPEIVAGYRRLAGAVHDHGGRVFVQLFHGGREQIASAPRAPAVAPSAVPTQRFHVEPRALTLREIRELLDGYTTSARKACDGGLDGIEVSAPRTATWPRSSSPPAPTAAPIAMRKG